VADAAVAEAVGMVAVAENNSDRASAALEQAVEIWKTLSRPYYAARCQVALSEAMLVAPDVRASCRAEAATLLAEAEVAFHDLGAMADERAASDIRRKTGTISPARRRRTASSRHGTVGGLTAREHDVLELLVAGSTNREIASALFIAESTAELHVSRILGKLGCATRAQAAVYAVNQGWFAHPPLGLVAS
jgi:DNA-binding NarL/FixJ family response regulator